uniref:Beta-lactamase domain-containing protein n=1 Tax=Dracunculus medinensis TaxID=318479 RepID=A0A0N4U849_DRAME
LDIHETKRKNQNEAPNSKVAPTNQIDETTMNSRSPLKGTKENFKYSSSSPTLAEPLFEIEKGASSSGSSTLSHSASNPSFVSSSPPQQRQKSTMEKTNEMYQLKNYNDVAEALTLFQNDELVVEPGNFYYSTHGFTLLSAVMEKVAGQPFKTQLLNFFREIGMNHSYVDENQPIISKRCRYYEFDKVKQKLVNAPEVNNSYKLAGGGILSNVRDLLLFANAILYSYKYSDDLKMPKGLLKSSTIKSMWQYNLTKNYKKQKSYYGLGWRIVPSSKTIGGNTECFKRSGCYLHTGSAVGANSILLIKPYPDDTSNAYGSCIVILVNRSSFAESLEDLAFDILETLEFDSSIIRRGYFFI